MLDSATIFQVREHFRSEFDTPEWKERFLSIQGVGFRPEKIADKGLENLFATLAHAFGSVGFYKQSLRKLVQKRGGQLRLSDFPVINNEVLLSNLGDFVSSHYNPGQIVVTHSSGSLGQPTPHIKSLNDEYVFNEGLRRRLENDFGMRADCEVIDLSPRYENVEGQIAEPLLSVEPAPDEHLIWRLRRYTSSNKDIVLEYEETVKRDIGYAFGAPSRFLGLLSFCASRGLRPKFTAIVSTFEQMHTGVRESLEAYFHCPVIDLYGSSEVGFVAWQCPKVGNMHIEEDLAFVEVLDMNSGGILPDGQLGRLVVTSMKSNLMPIIRFDTGDIGSIESIDCACGRSGKVITALEGRYAVSFIGQQNELVGPAKITDILKYLGVFPFQVVQRKKGYFDINLGPECDEKTMMKVQENMAKFIKSTGHCLNGRVISEDFIYTKNGKLNASVTLL